MLHDPGCGYNRCLGHVTPARLVALLVIVGGLFLSSLRPVLSVVRLPPEARSSTTARVIVLTSQCSGSNYLLALLNRLDGFRLRSERLIRYSQPNGLWENSSWTVYEAGLRTALGCQQTCEYIPNLHVFGFKLMYDQLPVRFYEHFAAFISHNNISLIHLKRNSLMQLGSCYQKFLHLTVGHGSAADVEQVRTRNAHISTKLKLDELQVNEVSRLEKNKDTLSLFLHTYVSSPVFEVTYEALDGAHVKKWISAIHAFVRPFKTQLDLNNLDVQKSGERECEKRFQITPYFATLSDQVRASCLGLQDNITVKTTWLELLMNASQCTLKAKGCMKKTLMLDFRSSLQSA